MFHFKVILEFREFGYEFTDAGRNVFPASTGAGDYIAYKREKLVIRDLGYCIKMYHIWLFFENLGREFAKLGQGDDILSHHNPIDEGPVKAAPDLFSVECPDNQTHY